MRLKHLQSALCSVPTPQFPQPNITLEQYATSPILTSHVIHTALTNEDIGPNMSCLDLGCGTGMLSIGSALVGCNLVLCVDCDPDAIQVAKENIAAMEVEESDIDNDNEECDIHEGDYGCKVEFILAKVIHYPNPDSVTNTSRNLKKNHKGGRGGDRYNSRGKIKQQHHKQVRNDPPSSIAISDDTETDTHSTNTNINCTDGIPLPSKCVDTVLTNPPFGTKHNAGIDISFLRTATRLARRAVYSFHKSSTRPYLVKTVQDWGYHVQVVAQMKFDIPKMYKFHNKDCVDVEVDLIRITFDE